ILSNRAISAEVQTTDWHIFEGDKIACLSPDRGVMFCNMCLSQTSFISSTLPGSVEMSLTKGFVHYFVPRYAGRFLEVCEKVEFQSLHPV
ncbi:MAG TPA: hypothetical protein VFY83_00560, partial [Anaerolineales bacterium]|nr:hypothetical protein [Anaerolineales bacterium]